MAIGYIAPLSKRPLYLGIVVSAFGIATCFGPIVGGAFTSSLTWRWCFWMYAISFTSHLATPTNSQSSNLPIGGVVFFTLLVTLKIRGADAKSRSLPLKTKMMNMDVAGAILLVGAVCCLLLALQWGGNSFPWNLRTLTNDAAVLRGIQAAYAKAVASTVYLAVAAACVSLPFAMFMEWKSVKPKAVPEEELKDDLATREKNA